MDKISNGVLAAILVIMTIVVLAAASTFYFKFVYSGMPLILAPG